MLFSFAKRFYQKKIVISKKNRQNKYKKTAKHFNDFRFVQFSTVKNQKNLFFFFFFKKKFKNKNPISFLMCFTQFNRNNLNQQNDYNDQIHRNHWHMDNPSRLCLCSTIHHILLFALFCNSLTVRLYERRRKKNPQFSVLSGLRVAFRIGRHFFSQSNFWSKKSTIWRRKNKTSVSHQLYWNL